MQQAKNVLGTELKVCGCTPMTGFYRDGYCRTDLSDAGKHTVCAKVTEDFLEFTRARGNDLSTPIPEFGFVGLKPGDHWCLCAERWKEAWQHGSAPLVILESCEESTLDTIPLDVLKLYAVGT